MCEAALQTMRISFSSLPSLENNKEENQIAAGPWTFPFSSTVKRLVLPQWGQLTVLREPSFLPTFTLNLLPQPLCFGHFLVLQQVIFTSVLLDESLFPLFFDTPYPPWKNFIWSPKHQLRWKMKQSSSPSHEKTDLEDRLNLQKVFDWKLSRFSDRLV